MYLRALIFLGLACAATAGAQTTMTQSASLSVDAARDGRLAIDLGGDLWIVPGNGGDARQLPLQLESVRSPRWSPDAGRLVFAARREGRQGIWILDVNSGQTSALSVAASFDLYADWHPDGERVLLSSDASGEGFDLFEVDVPTGLRWRISKRPGDEIEGAWSADGRDLVYVHHYNDEWSLILRRHGQTEEVLLRSDKEIAAPSWRPDGSLITFFSRSDTETTLDIVILSEPRLVRPFATRERFFVSPVSWLDRHTMVFSAGGQIKKRRFDAWSSRTVQFRASVTTKPAPASRPERPTFEWPDEPGGDLVIRASRLFDGLATTYLHDRDLVIKGGRIAAISDQQERPGLIVIDMGDLTVLPGFVDADARLPGALAPSHGPEILAAGVTSIVAQHPDLESLDRRWAGKATPGPRFLNLETFRPGPLPAPERDATAAVVTSQSTGISTGAALPVQIRALEIAGLTPLQTLRAIGVNAAGAIQADPYIGRIAVGATADLVFVDGDPLTDIDAVLNVVAVVRNGRFYSVSGLFDRAKPAASVD